MVFYPKNNLKIGTAAFRSAQSTKDGSRVFCVNFCFTSNTSDILFHRKEKPHLLILTSFNVIDPILCTISNTII